MPGLKKHLPDIRFSANKLTADELDLRVNYRVQNPTVSGSFFGSVVGTGTGLVAALALTNVQADYPRNVLVSITGVAGGAGGTVSVTGTDQFGGTQSESIGFATAAAGGTAVGTKVFNTISAATATFALIGGTGVGTASLGVAIGTAAGQEAWFGLPVRIESVSDVKKIMWNDNAVMTAVNGGTVTSSYVNTTTHAFTHGQIVAAADGIYVDVLTTYDSTNNSNLS